MKLSPLNARRLAIFSANRRGYWSLWIFLALLVLSLFAEVIANDRPLFVWYDGAGYPHLLGTAAEAADLYQAIGAFLLRGELDPEVIDEYDERWGNSFSISEAVAEAIAYGIGDDPEQIANRIRVAAAAGRIRGARNSHGGAWSFSKRTFRGWLVRAKTEKRGRPRKGGA